MYIYVYVQYERYIKNILTICEICKVELNDEENNSSQSDYKSFELNKPFKLNYIVDLSEDKTANTFDILFTKIIYKNYLQKC